MRSLDPKIDVLEIEDMPDGSATVKMDANEDFVSWFKELSGCQEFSQEKFQQWFLVVLDEHVRSSKEL